MPDDSRTRTTPVTFQLDLETATALADPVTRARIERLIRISNEGSRLLADDPESCA